MYEVVVEGSEVDIPPTNGWADGTDEPRTGTVSSVLC